MLYEYWGWISSVVMRLFADLKFILLASIYGVWRFYPLHRRFEADAGVSHAGVCFKFNRRRREKRRRLLNLKQTPKIPLLSSWS